jgi:two-component system sensor histidine kinase KdpD
MQRGFAGCIRFVIASAIAAITFCYKHILVANQTTVALSFPLALSSFSGVGNDRLGIHVDPGHAGLQLFLLPPVGAFTIADPQNWVALAAFLFTSTAAASFRRVRKEADEANSRRHEIERLYKFSQKLLGEGNVIQLMNAIPNYIVDSFEAGGSCFCRKR